MTNSSSSKRKFFAGLYGNVIEWYDFLLYAYFAPIFAHLFFPVQNEGVSLIITFSVFAGGFLMRPLGGLILGHYGDHSGRRKMLIASISTMTLGTGCIAFLPTYQAIGIAAPILFTVLRLLQGFSVGAELSGSATYLVESASSNRRGIMGSLATASAFVGILLGSFVASFICLSLPEEAVGEWGWRAAYFLGALLGLFGLYLRLKSQESRAFSAVKKPLPFPAKTLFLHHSKELIISIALTSILAVSNYLLIAYVTTFLTTYEGFSLQSALEINFLSLFFLTGFIVCTGWLSDEFGRKPVLLMCLISILITAYPIFWLLQQKSYLYALYAEIILAIVMAPLNGVIPTIIAELFPTSIRNSGSAIGFNLSQAIFGGTAPLIALSLVKMTHEKSSPALYLVLCAGIAILAWCFIKESYHKNLE